MRFYRGNPEFLSVPRRRMLRLLCAMPVLVFAYLFVAGDTGFYHIYYRDRQIEAFREKLEARRQENHRLERETTLLRDDLRTIEQIARERYGMVKKNEMVYMVYPYLPGKAPAP
ncbi:MAG: septum formation initiator family protein [bacterium]|nr:septum formation initiator family protein [bacterium]